MAYKILLTEDDKSTKKVLGYRLEHCGYEAIFASSSDEVLKRLHEGIDLLILDSLPGRNGSALCKSIKEYERKIPIIILSAQARKKDIDNGMKAGADCYIAKPFDSEALLAEIEKLIKRKGQ